MRPRTRPPFDEERERLRAGALLAALLDLAVATSMIGLIDERRGEQRLGVADAAALLQVVERVEGAEHPGARGAVACQCLDLVESSRRRPRAVAHASTIVPSPSVTCGCRRP